MITAIVQPTESCDISAIRRIAFETQWVAVLGGSKQFTNEQIRAAYKIGCELGRLRKNLITGATTGVPYAAALGAQHSGALVLGISPASSSSEHVLRCGKPLDATDITVYSGMNVEGRGPLILRSSAAAIFIGGELGTLQEFTSAFMCGNKVLGVVENLGGISDRLRDLLATVENYWGNKVLFDSDPVELARRVCREIDALPVDPAVTERSNNSGREVRGIIDMFVAEQRTNG